MYIKLGIGDLALSLGDLTPALVINILALPILASQFPSNKWKASEFIGFTEYKYWCNDLVKQMGNMKLKVDFDSKLDTHVREREREMDQYEK